MTSISTTFANQLPKVIPVSMAWVLGIRWIFDVVEVFWYCFYFDLSSNSTTPSPQISIDSCHRRHDRISMSLSDFH